ncbi:hypothetical protein GCM10007067_12350 [Lysobacter bugurensis]|uniref:Uncharacterized protein n=1 Tax=Cognatilysobacter bugurensis TaxID=543356 RepID=A0A918W7B5_9GAMM|nr:hypothetical protein GCM10007067_12350 [Lysobacter bugurensis]
MASTQVGLSVLFVAHSSILCAAFKKRVDAAKGDVRLLSTAETGTRGNTHMMMMDKNNLQVADLILSWINQQVR